MLRGPTLHVLQGNASQGIYPDRFIVQAGDVVECFSTSMQEGFAAFHANFFQSFKAVACKSWAHHIDTLGAALGQ
jgi:hypothetical protein